MKFLVGFDEGPAAKRALALACEQARHSDARIYVVTSMEGGDKETLDVIRKAEEALRWAEEYLLKQQIQCETVQLARGLSPGEDLVKFAEDNAIDHIFLGIEKTSRTRKIILGSTAQFIILKGPCPVTTTK
jgi:nucleotide-binding universal stress UspA family protein